MNAPVTSASFVMMLRELVAHGWQVDRLAALTRLGLSNDEMLIFLTRRDAEDQFSYLDTLIEESGRTPEFV